MSIQCLVMTYGVPDESDLAGKEMQREYARRIAKWLARFDRKKVIDVHLCGGVTNRRRPEVTEARYFYQLLIAAIEMRFGQGHEITVTYYPETASDARTALRYFNVLLMEREQLSAGPYLQPRVVVFCEQHRYERVEHLAMHTLGDEVQVEPIKFDHREYRRRDYVMRGLEYTSAWLGTHVPGFVLVERGLREIKLRWL